MRVFIPLFILNWEKKYCAVLNLFGSWVFTLLSVNQFLFYIKRMVHKIKYLFKILSNLYPNFLIDCTFNY